MKSYDEKLEELLLAKDFAALSAQERAHVARTLGGEAAYAAERSLRLRSRSMLAAEAAPADPGGLAQVMARVGAATPARSSAYRMPVWQAAAAALLLAILTWWGRGLAMPELSEAAARPATADTVFTEVRVVDTIYMAAPSAPGTPRQVGQANPAPQKQVRRTPKRGPQAPPSQLAVAIEVMPDPGDASRNSGSPQAAGYRPHGQTAISDGTSIGN